ncbi:glycosyltransferase family 4 protein [Spirosoma soli]|uniref:Glycosyltransferase family 4 protein n=1 Tax=Spirosoma soli TaxID=1770529 RepID=A0ABW5LWG8_9BACT
MNVLWLAATSHSSKAGHPMPWITALANSLVAKQDVNINVVSYNPFIKQDEEVVQNGVKYTFLKVPDDKWDLLRGYTGRIKLVQNYLKDIASQYDLMHIHGAEQQYHVMGHGVNLPKVLSAQGFVTEYYRHLPSRPEYRHLSWLVAGYYEKRYMPSVKHFICRTHWDKAIVRQMHPNAIVHHNWELIRPEFYREIEPSTGTERNAVLFVGGVNYIKGIREALQTIDTLRKTRPIRFIVTGGGNKEELLKMVTTLGLKNIKPEDIEHRGMLSAAQLWATYHEAFCLLHPSYIDNSPNSVCEAQLAGLPVVASDVGGVASLVENYKTGLLTTLNVPEIVKAVEVLWENVLLRETLAQQAREVSLERFDQQQIVGITESIYQEVLANP